MVPVNAEKLVIVRTSVVLMLHGGRDDREGMGDGVGDSDSDVVCRLWKLLKEREKGWNRSD